MDLFQRTLYDNAFGDKRLRLIKAFGDKWLRLIKAAPINLSFYPFYLFYLFISLSAKPFIFF